MFQTRPRRFVKTARMLKRVLNEIVPISQLCFVIGDFIHLLQNQVPFLIIYLLLFLAESGAGKSTLLKKILKQTNPSNVFLFWIFLLFFYEKIFFQVFQFLYRARINRIFLLWTIYPFLNLILLLQLIIFQTLNQTLQSYLMTFH